VSLTPKPNGDRREEVFVAQQILQSLGLRSFAPQVTACPGCGRTTSTFFQHMAEDIQGYLREQMPVWRESRPGVVEMKVAVMGCVGMKEPKAPVYGTNRRSSTPTSGVCRHLAAGHLVRGTAMPATKAPVYVDGKRLLPGLLQRTVARSSSSTIGASPPRAGHTARYQPFPRGRH
jgi:(E)-4-hydroxy-3-methylbut-2-enyl-diphosphate synthase